MSIFAASLPIWGVKSLNDTALGKFRGWERMPGRYQGYFCGVLCTWALGFRCQGMPLVWKEMLREDHGIFHPVYQRVGSPKDGSIFKLHGSLNVPIEHHPTIRYMVYNGYYKVMSNIPKMGHLPTPELWWQRLWSWNCLEMQHACCSGLKSFLELEDSLCLLGIELWNQVALPENKGLHTKNPMAYHHFPRSQIGKGNPPMFRSHILNSWLPVKCI